MTKTEQHEPPGWLQAAAIGTAIGGVALLVAVLRSAGVFQSLGM